MMLSKSAVGVVIVSYNTRELLRGCLESLRCCTLPLQVVVVDNGSTDGSQHLVADHFPETLLVASGRNLGFGAGNNLGVRVVEGGTGRPGNQETGKPENQKTRKPETRELVPHSPIPNPQSPIPHYLLLLNPDTVVRRGAIEALVAFLDAHPRVGLVGPRLLNPDGSVQAAAFRFPTLSMALLDLFPPGEVLPGRLYNSWWHGRYSQEQQDNPAPFPIDHPLGACMLVRREAFAEVEGFDERYFMYSEEIDLCWRIREASWAIWQVPTAQVVHYGGAATGQFRQRMFVELYRSRLQFAADHRGSLFQLAQQAIIRVGSLRATLRAWRDYRAGSITHDELRARLWAFGQVGALAQRRTIDDRR